MACKAIKLPKNVDDMPLILLWNADEIIPFLVCLCFGFVIGELTICCVIGVVFNTVCTRYSRKYGEGSLNHVLYRYGFNYFNSRSIPNPFIKEFY